MAKRREAGKIRFLDGTFRRLLFSRSGHVSGVVLKVDHSTVSVMMSPREGAAILGLVRLGIGLPLLVAERDAFYTLISLATLEGRPRPWPMRPISGVE